MLIAQWSRSKLLHAFSEYVRGGIPHHKEDFPPLSGREGMQRKGRKIVTRPLTKLHLKIPQKHTQLLCLSVKQNRSLFPKGLGYLHFRLGVDRLIPKNQ